MRNPSITIPPEPLGAPRYGAPRAKSQPRCRKLAADPALSTLLEALSPRGPPADMGSGPHFMLPPPFKSRGDSLIGQVVAANVVLVTLTVFAASLAAGLDLSISQQRWQFVVLALVIVLTFC